MRRVVLKEFFSEETAGFTDHHVALFRSEQLELASLDTECGSKILIDRTGVTDPESD
jgi:hypothetical protein